MSWTGVGGKAKNANALAVSGIFGIKGPLSQTDEFQKAGIIVRTIHVQKNGEMLQEEVLCAGEYAQVADMSELYILLQAFYPDYYRDAAGNKMTLSSQNHK